MLKTNKAFDISLKLSIAYLDEAMRRPFVEVDYSPYEAEILAKEAKKLRARMAKQQGSTNELTVK
ncbi:MAG: hypothetical protein CMH32_00310 [Micavibrio sp.]|nr:hypothetical protein [Micavibrio sp.]HCK32324.1 hypothetical protein [Rhodospirillaceae bacterium]|tara:strand:+ start:501 stop:695 length:195 start_codon:yes stop_codon:yes gene_type:complete